MRTRTEDIVAGFPALSVRKLMRFRRFGVRAIEECLGLSPVDALRATEVLVRDGLIEPDELGDKDAWRTTLKGNALGLARANKPLTRKTADRLVRELLDRVREVERNPYYLYRVAKLGVFGSYLRTEVDRLGDIDLFIEFAPKEQDPNRRMELNRERTREAIRAGRRFSNYLAELYWAEIETSLFVRAKSKYLSLHSSSDPILTQTEWKLLYPET